MDRPRQRGPRMASQRIWVSGWLGMISLLVSSFPVTGQEARPAATIKPSVAVSDGKALLRAARAALERGDLDRAETLTAEAEKAPRQFAAWKNWSAETPAKLWRAIQAARSIETAAL